MLRHYLFEGIENFRDLGGYETPYGATSYGVVYRSGFLFMATEGDLDKLSGLGIKTIIDLRNAKDKADYPSRTLTELKINTIFCDVNGNGRVPTSRLDQENSYMEMVEDPVTAKAIFLALAHSAKPVLIHCNAGKDRTGMFVALLLLANGVAIEDINGDYLLSFPYLEKLGVYTKKNHPEISSIIYTPSVSFLPRVIKKFLKRFGSLSKYFRWIGLKDEDIALLQNLLGKQEKSCGAVIFNGGKVLIEHMRKGHYSIPKGHVEVFDENEMATALREIKEETNLDAKIIDSNNKFTIDYSPKVGRAKRVVFFLATTDSIDTSAQLEEVTETLWLEPKEALAITTNASDKSVLSWAFEEIKKYH